jgi:hypothetical protein|tara:strand:- start:586 stop:855 length:270 start_codon:yes stop_codon:yes gene_type:complete
MENTRAITRKLTLGEYVDLLYVLKKSLWSIEVRIDEKKESMQKTEYAPLLGIYKHTHDLLVDEAKQLSSSISTIEENSLSLWSDEESGQ